MSVVLNLIRTIRPLNLAILAVMLLLIRYTLILPIMDFGGLPSGLSNTLYLLVIITVICIAAGGYLINDYFDKGIDSINKPGKNRVDSGLSRTTTLIAYSFFTLSGLSFSILIGIKTGFKYPFGLVLLCAGLLFFYSSSYKKMLLAGNIVVSLLTATAVFFSIVFDRHALLSAPVLTGVSAYSIFAFFISMVREIIKDCEDARGDQLFGANTLPVVIGIRGARMISALFAVGLLITIGWIQYSQEQWDNIVAFAYVIIAVQLPLLILSLSLFLQDKDGIDRRNSRLSKWIMVSGILSMPVFYLTSL
jgi:4-hydroxybenzoate polyprenyltransferase